MPSRSYAEEFPPFLGVRLIGCPISAEKKKQKLSEIQSGVEEAESLVNIEPISLGSLTCIIMRSTILVLTYIQR